MKLQKHYGVKKEDLEEIEEMDIDEELKENKLEENELEEDEKKEEKNDNEQEELTSDETRKLDIREETSANKNLKGQTLRSKLGLEKEGITDVRKIARVSTSSLERVEGEKISNQIDTFVAIKSNGEAVVLGENILKPDNRSGTNPTQQSTTIESSTGKVKKEAVTSSYKIVNGNGEEYLQAGYDEVSGKEIKYAMRSHTTGEFVTIELETQRTLPQDSKVRQFLNDRNQGIYEADRILQRDKEHDEECEQKDVTVIDDDRNNDSHTHFELDENYLDKCVDEILEIEQIDETFTRNEVKERLVNIFQKNKEIMDLEEIKEKAKQDLEYDAEMLNRERK